jgi:hypothetical protein
MVAGRSGARRHALPPDPGLHKSTLWEVPQALRDGAAGPHNVSYVKGRAQRGRPGAGTTHRLGAGRSGR